MEKRSFIVLMALFVVFVGFQFAEPAAAVKVVDHGTNYGYSGQNGWMKVTWKTYQYNNNFLKTYRTFYTKNPKTKKYNIEFHEIDTITKVTKNSVKITTLCYATGGGKFVSYAKTKLTASQY